MTDEELKPCPFCGGDKNTICKTDYDGGDAYAVSCRYPDCHGAIFTLGYGYFHTKDQAIAAWNTRAVDPDGWIAEQKLFEAMLNEQAFVIREAALREAADVAAALAVKWWKEYKDRLSPHCADPQYQGMSDGADDVAEEILALIGDKK
jgi:Lar family restriction alleviation protein